MKYGKEALTEFFELYTQGKSAALDYNPNTDCPICVYSDDGKGSPPYSVEDHQRIALCINGAIFT